jgi:hypothetical protein
MIRWRRLPRIPVGTHGPWFFRRTLSLSLAEARTHVHCLGISGSGKSRWLTGWVRGLLAAGQGVVFLDPHGDTARLVLAHLVAAGFFDQPDAFDRLRYLDVPGAARQGRYLPLNWLRQPRIGPHSLAAHVKEAFHRCWPELATGAPMFDTLLQDGVKVLVSNGLPLTRLYRLLTDKPFRDQLLTHEDDPDVVAFWRDQYDRLSPRDQADQAGAALRRAHLLTFHPVLKASLGSDDLLLPFREVLDRGTTLLVNLALPDEESKRLLGCLLTVFAEQAALSRADRPPGERLRSSFLVIDEFSSFSATSAEALATMLSQTRKFGLYATLAHQHWTQASERLRGALQNVGLEVTFQTGREDAERSAKILGRVDPLAVKKTESVWFNRAGEPTVIDERSREYPLAEQWEAWAQDLTDLPTGWCYLKRRHGRAVKVKSLPVPDPRVDPDALAAVEERYLRRCFRPPAPAAATGGAPVPVFARPPVRRWEPVA